MKIAKSILRKTENSDLNPYESLLDQHNTPTVDMTTSPAQRFLHRRLKSEIPMKATLHSTKISKRTRWVGHSLRVTEIRFRETTRIIRIVGLLKTLPFNRIPDGEK